MTMTREEAIAEIERLLECAKKLEGPQTFVEFRPAPALEMALAALRPVSREQVERVWRGEWIYDPDTSYMYCEICKHTICQTYYLDGNPPPFCEMCGAPMTDEAVKMVMKRLEEIYKWT